MPSRKVIVARTTYPRVVAKHIWEISEGFFVYCDEAENLSDNIYCSIEEATVALNHYADWLNQPAPEGVIYE